MTGVTILAVENQVLCKANGKQKCKRVSERVYIGDGGICSGREGQDRAKRARTDENNAEASSGGRSEASSTRAPSKCSRCRSLDHTARSCPDRFRKM